MNPAAISTYIKEGYNKSIGACIRANMNIDRI